MSANLKSIPIITVLGSINMDLVIRCARLPRPGETVSGHSAVEIPGGKGANQAVAAARCGAKVRMIGAVGDDTYGHRLLQHLIDQSVDCSAVSVMPSCETGLALITVEEGGENSIVVVPGANGRITADDVDRFRSTIATSDLLMLQLETPLPVVQAAIQIARQCGVRVILDPAPAVKLPDEMFDVDLICPNESEAITLVGGVLDTMDDATAIAKRLYDKGSRAVAITLGARGTLLYDGSIVEQIPSITVDAVDSTAAGDAFAGAVAVRWAETGSLIQSVRWANIAGALAASKPGAQPSLPTRAAINAIDNPDAVSAQTSNAKFQL